MNGSSFIIIRHSHCLTLCPSPQFYCSLLLLALHLLEYCTANTSFQLVFLKKILHTAVIFCGVNFSKFKRPNEKQFPIFSSGRLWSFGLQVFTLLHIQLELKMTCTLTYSATVPVFVQGHATLQIVSHD